MVEAFTHCSWSQCTTSMVRSCFLSVAAMVYFLLLADVVGWRKCATILDWAWHAASLERSA
jgi:hypothetical protein